VFLDACYVVISDAESARGVGGQTAAPAWVGGRTPSHGVVGRGRPEPLALRTDMPALRLLGCNSPSQRASELRSCAANRNITPRGAPQYWRRGVVVGQEVCIAGDDTARLAPGGTTPHSNTFFAWPVPRVL